MARSRLAASLLVVILVAALAACGGDSSTSPQDDQGGTDCATLTATLDEANLGVELATELSTHSDSEEGAAVNSLEADEIQTLKNDQAAAQDAVDTAGC